MRTTRATLTTPPTILVAALLAAMLATGCEDSSGGGAPSPEEATTSGAVDGSGQSRGGEGSDGAEAGGGASAGGGAAMAAEPPRIQFETRAHDIGRLSEIDERTLTYPFTNVGGQTLEIRAVNATCGCTTPSLEKTTYEPGESGEIVVKFDPTGPGEQRKPITVITNAVPPQLQLMVIADVEAFAILEPRMISVDSIPYGEEFWTSFTVSSPDPQFVIESVSTTNPHVSATLVTPGSDPNARPGDEPREERVQVVIRDTAPWGKLQSWIDVTMSGKPTPDSERVQHTARMRVQGSVFGSLNAMPDTFRFGSLPGDSFTREVILQHMDGTPFEIRSISVERGNLAAADVDVEPAGVGVHRLTLTATAPAQPGTVLGRVIVETDVAGEERIVLDIVGTVRTPVR